ncbi:hypothetical protein BGZ65_011845, partial [Modicella reniformis]
MAATKVLGNIRKSVMVRRSFLYRHYAIFRRRLEERKHEEIDLIESLMSPMSLNGMNNNLWYLNTDDRRDMLYNFSGHKWYLRKTWDFRKAQQATYDYGVKAILELGNGSEGRSKVDNQSVVFAIGLGTFITRTGMPSKHSAST